MYDVFTVKDGERASESAHTRLFAFTMNDPRPGVSRNHQTAVSAPRTQHVVA